MYRLAGKLCVATLFLFLSFHACANALVGAVSGRFSVTPTGHGTKSETLKHGKAQAKKTLTTTGVTQAMNTCTQSGL